MGAPEYKKGEDTPITISSTEGKYYICLINHTSTNMKISIVIAALLGLAAAVPLAEMSFMEGEQSCLYLNDDCKPKGKGAKCCKGMDCETMDVRFLQKITSHIINIPFLNFRAAKIISVIQILHSRGNRALMGGLESLYGVLFSKEFKLGRLDRRGEGADR